MAGIPRVIAQEVELIPKAELVQSALKRSWNNIGSVNVPIVGDLFHATFKYFVEMISPYLLGDVKNVDIYQPQNNIWDILRFALATSVALLPLKLQYFLGGSV